MLRSKTLLLFLTTLLFPICSFAFMPFKPSAAKKESTVTRVAILGCHRQFEPAPALAHYVGAEADLCVWIGDNVYADTKDDPSFIQKCYDALGAKPAFRALKEDVPYVVTWDDHDYGLNNAGKEYALKNESRAMFIDFWGLQTYIPSDREGVFYSRNFKFGKYSLQAIMLDCRWERDEPDTDGKMLSESQWTWLENELKKEADLILLCTGSQVLLDKEPGSETWENYPTEMQRLFDMVKNSKAEHVVLITGDQHYGEVNRLDNAFGYDAIELQFSGVNQRENPEFNSYRVSPVADSRHSMALIDVQWEDSDTEVAHLLYRVFDTYNQKLELTYRVNLSELKN